MHLGRPLPARIERRVARAAEVARLAVNLRAPRDLRRAPLAGPRCFRGDSADCSARIRVADAARDDKLRVFVSHLLRHLHVAVAQQQGLVPRRHPSARVKVIRFLSVAAVRRKLQDVTPHEREKHPPAAPCAVQALHLRRCRVEACLVPFLSNLAPREARDLAATPQRVAVQLDGALRAGHHIGGERSQLFPRLSDVRVLLRVGPRSSFGRFLLLPPFLLPRRFGEDVLNAELEQARVVLFARAAARPRELRPRVAQLRHLAQRGDKLPVAALGSSEVQWSACWKRAG